MKKLGIFAVTVFCVLTLQASATIMVDNFNQGTISNYVNQGTQFASGSNSGLNTTNTVGGARYAAITWQDGTENTTLQINPQGDNAQKCSFGSNPGNDGYFELLYGSTGDLNADMTDGGTQGKLALFFIFSDVRGTSTVTFTTTGLGSSTLSMENPIGGTMSEWLYFEYPSFSGSADFEDVDQITIRLDSTAGADITLDMVETGLIPEPATAALMGLFGVAILWRRRSIRRA